MTLNQLCASRGDAPRARTPRDTAPQGVSLQRASGPASFCAGCGRPIERPRKGRRKWCSDRCRKQTLYSTPCVICGAPTAGDGAYHRYCRRHGYIPASAARHQRRIERQNRIAELWHEGKTLKQIAATLGSTVGSVRVELVHMRHDGYELRERVRTGWGEWGFPEAA